ncbi:MAG: hypothetical protein J5978_09030 [Spirochaetaceae bacterium]|nr:hypothetical protein [Spirochaetaceae bacterium]
MMIVYREKENGTLTESARINLLDFLGRACDYLLRDEPEIHMEVRKMMKPAFKLLTEENAELKKRTANLSGENTELKTRIENSIKNVIEKNRINQIDISQTKEMIQNIFDLSESETEEMLKKYR